MSIVLASYNTHRCIGGDGRFDPGRTVGVLKELRADVIALQEVEANLENEDNLLTHLAREAGLQAVAGPTLFRRSGHYGNALLLRGRVLEVGRIDLSVPGSEPRGALDVVVGLDGVTIQVVATHLGLKPKERRLQIRRLLDQFRLQATDYQVLMGDLNAWFLWGRPLRWLHTLFEEAPAPATFPSRHPIFALDRIWVKPRYRLSNLTVHNSALARSASDHLPVTAVVQFDAPRAGDGMEQSG